MDHVVGGKFKLGKKIGSGSFGELFLGEFSAYPFFTYSRNTPHISLGFSGERC